MHSKEQKLEERWKLALLFCLHGSALGMWGVSLASVLRAYGMELLVPYAFATTSVAALISPLGIGALADQKYSSERVLRWLGTGAMVFLGLLFWSIDQRWSPWLVILLAQIHALFSAPTFGLTTSLVMSRLTDAKQQFGRLRLWATLGWMASGLLISWVFHTDRSPWSGWAGCICWAMTLLCTFTLSPLPPSQPKPHRTWKEVLGLDALHLLRHHDHGIVFLTSCLLSIPLAAFYPFTVMHLMDLGVEHPIAAMTLGQITEAIAMVWLSSILNRTRLKWVFLLGIGFGVLRYGLYVTDSEPFIYLGIFLHGLCYTLFFITGQIYLEQRIPGEMRARAQALLTLMISGIGSLTGTLACGWWWARCRTGAQDAVDWPVFWAGLMLTTGLVFVFFALAYRGRRTS
jgi:MFS family permease